MSPPASEFARVTPTDDLRCDDADVRHEHIPGESAPGDVADIVGRMLAASRIRPDGDRVVLQECIEATQAAAQAATACADACLAEEMVEELVDCVRTLLTTADICQTTARVLSRRDGTRPELARALVSTCATACRAGREVAEEHAPIHFHCQVCARVCRSAERACRALLGALR